MMMMNMFNGKDLYYFMDLKWKKNAENTFPLKSGIYRMTKSEGEQ